MLLVIVSRPSGERFRHPTQRTPRVTSFVGDVDDDALTIDELARRLDRASGVPQGLTGDVAEARRRGDRTRQRRRQQWVALAVATPVVVGALAGGVAWWPDDEDDDRLVLSDLQAIVARSTPAGDLVVRRFDDDRLAVEVGPVQVVVPRGSTPLAPFETLALPGASDVFGVTSGATIDIDGGAVDGGTIAVVAVVALHPDVTEVVLTGAGGVTDRAPLLDDGRPLSDRRRLRLRRGAGRGGGGVGRRIQRGRGRTNG